MNQDIEPQVIQGNLAVHTHPSDVSQFGDGSIEVEGRIYTDKIVSYTTSGSTDIHDTSFTDTLVSFKVGSTPSVAPVNRVIQYIDPTLKRLRQVNEDSEVTALVDAKGDLITSTGSQEVIVPLGTNGYILTADSTLSSGLAWRSPPSGVFVDVAQYVYIQSLAESNTNSTSFITKATLSKTLSATTLCRFGVAFQWRMTVADQLFKSRLIVNDSTVVFECNEFSGGFLIGSTTQQARAGFGIISLPAGTHTFKLQWAVQSAFFTGYISNAKIEVWNVS